MGSSVTLRKWCTWAWVLPLLTWCGGDLPAGDDSTEGTTTSGVDTDTDGLPDLQQLESFCSEAPKGAVGRWSGTLRQASSDLGGACGQGGPDAFLRLTAPVRTDVRVQAQGVGFVPRVGVMLGGCEERWEDRGVLCTAALEGWVYDVPAGTPMVISVGIAPGDPALLTPAGSVPDALDFVLDVGMRPVLGAGQYCDYDGAGRCAVGTACVASDADTPATCVTLDADTCAAPELSSLQAAGGMLLVDPGALQTDAHTQSCGGGGRMRERVFRLSLPPGLAPSDVLEIHADHPEVALAVRAPGCELGAEVACSPPTAAGSAVTVLDVATLEAAGIAPYLFVELPDSLGPEDPVVVLEYVLVGP